MPSQPASHTTSHTKSAILYRMVMDKHICPFGLKSKDLLERHGYQVDDRWLTSREQTDAFKEEHNVDTTPQTFIDGKRIGGFDELAVLLGEKNLKPSKARPLISR